jgi:hypothetical protein
MATVTIETSAGTLMTSPSCRPLGQLTYHTADIVERIALVLVYAQPPSRHPHGGQRMTYDARPFAEYAA